MKHLYHKLTYWIHRHTERACDMVYLACLGLWVLLAWWAWLTKGS